MRRAVVPALAAVLALAVLAPTASAALALVSPSEVGPWLADPTLFGEPAHDGSRPSEPATADSPVPFVHWSSPVTDDPAAYAARAAPDALDPLLLGAGPSALAPFANSVDVCSAGCTLTYVPSVAPPGPAAPPVLTVDASTADAPVSDAADVRSTEPDVTVAAVTVGSTGATDAAALVAAATAAAGAVGLVATALYTRLAGAAALRSPLRRQIVDLATTRPGLSETEIADAVQVHRTTARHHLRILRAAGSISSVRVRGRDRFYAVGDPRGPAAAKANALAALPSVAALLAAVAAQPGVALSEAARAAGLSRQLAHLHSRPLADAGLVVLHRAADGRLLCYPPAPTSATTAP